MKKILSLAILSLFSSFLVSAAMPAQPTYAACGDARFLTMPAWYRGVAKQESGSCNVSVEAVGGDLEKFIWTIAFNIVEIMLHMVAYISIGFIIFGGFKYMISAGNESGIAGAKKTIINAVIGLLISIMSIGMVNFISNFIF